MKHSRLAAPALALALLAASTSAFAQGYGTPPPPPGYGQDHGYDHDRDHDRWDAPPPEFREFQQKGYHDGVEGARRDFENHRPPNPNNRDEFRHPQVPREMRGDYREGFRKGYFAAMHHIHEEAEHGYGPR